MYKGKRWFALPVLALLVGLVLLAWPRVATIPEPERDASEPDQVGDFRHDAAPGEESGPGPTETNAKLSGTLAGRVVWPDGTPFRGEFIGLDSNTDRSRPIRPIFRPPDGRFRFEPVPEGPCRIYAADLIGRTATPVATWDVETGREDYVLVIEDRPDRPVLSIRVEGPDGRPVAEAVALVEVLGNYGTPQDRKIRVLNGTAHAALRFPCRRILLAVFEAVAADGSRLGERTLGPLRVTREPLVVRLDGERPLTGRVTGPDGAGLACVYLCAGLRPPVLTHVVACGIHDTTILTDTDGTFRFPGLSKANYLLVVEPPPGWARPDDIRVAPETTWLDIRLRRAAAPQVRVLDPGDSPVGGCKVEVLEGPMAYEETHTNEKGVAHLDALALDPDREYTLRVRPPRQKKHEVRGGVEDWPVERKAKVPARPLAAQSVRNWRPADTTVRLVYAEPAGTLGETPAGSLPRGSGTLHIRIANWPRADEHVVVETGSISCGTGEEKFQFTPPDFVIKNLRPDRTYTIRIAGVGDGLTLEAAGLTPGPEMVELSLEPGLRITGWIELPPGTEYASLEATRGALRVWEWNSAVVHADGRFEIIGLLPGTWRVEVDVRAGEEWYDAECDVEAGASVRLVPR